MVLWGRAELAGSCPDLREIPSVIFEMRGRQLRPARVRPLAAAEPRLPPGLLRQGRGGRRGDYAGAGPPPLLRPPRMPERIPKNAISQGSSRSEICFFFSSIVSSLLCSRARA